MSHMPSGKFFLSIKINLLIQSTCRLESFFLLVRNMEYKRCDKLGVSDSQRVGWCSSLVNSHFLRVIGSRSRFLCHVSGQVVTAQHGKSRLPG